MIKRTVLIVLSVAVVTSCTVFVASRTLAAGDLSPKEARRIIARMADIRTGDRRWEDVELLMKALNVEKTARARAELESIATALESYRRERGSYVETKSEAALVDHLSPRYLARVIRV